MDLIAVWYVGCFIFAINGLVWMGQRNEARTVRVAAESTERLVRKYIRKRGVR